MAQPCSAWASSRDPHFFSRQVWVPGLAEGSPGMTKFSFSGQQALIQPEVGGVECRGRDVFQHDVVAAEADFGVRSSLRDRQLGHRR